ncbi:hypothetical protein AX14_001133 [Amanita brunnescens Koide BX004]|nr:hypothetical protein AX14_001133 [Amanita brunnescens Koide BX004]
MSDGTSATQWAREFLPDDMPITPAIRLGDRLSKACLSSKDITAVDHMIFFGLFGSRLHEPMAIAQGLSTNKLAIEYIRKWRPEEVVGKGSNKQEKWEWSRCNDDDFLRFVRFMVKDLIVQYPQTAPYTGAMKWSLEAYLAIILPSSPLKMKKITYRDANVVGKEGNDDTGRKYHFGLVAKCPLPSGVFIHQLIGLMASDASTPHSRLSEIHPHPDNLGPREPRILVGPGRLLNHCCSIRGSKNQPNVAWCALTDRHAYCVYTLKAIKEQEELLIDYGSDYFDGKCPCPACS